MKVSKMSGEASMLRKQRLNFLMKRFRKQWSIYYRSSYGKAGFYILIFFLVVTVLSPVLVLHNPFFYIAPTEDTFAGEQLFQATVPFATSQSGYVYPPAASVLATQGAYVNYLSSPSGAIYAIGLGATPATSTGHMFLLKQGNSSSTMFPVQVFPLADTQRFLASSTLTFNNYLLSGYSNGSIYLNELGWSSKLNVVGQGIPIIVTNESASVNGTLVMSPVSNSVPQTETAPTGAPFDNYQLSLSSTLEPALVFVVSSNSTGYYLSEFSAVPLQHIWSVKLPFNSIPSEPVFTGGDIGLGNSGYLNATEIMIAQNSSMLAFSPSNGRMLWMSNTTSPVNTNLGIYVPFGYDLSYSSTNMAFVALNGSNSVVGFHFSNGSQVPIFTTRSAPTGMISSNGISGFPSSFIIQTANVAYVLNAPESLIKGGNISLPTTKGAFDRAPNFDSSSSSAFLVSSGGLIVSISTEPSAHPIRWASSISPAPGALSQPVIFRDANTGLTAITILTESGHLYTYATIGVDLNPLPPTLKTPSGAIYLLGTNQYGNDVFSQWVASFYNDWIVGLSVAIGTILLSVLVGMYIGYTTGFKSTVVETVTLVIFLMPGLPLLIVVASILGPTFTNLILVLIVLGWPFTTFTLIGVVKSLKSRSFVEAAKVSGAGTLQILRRHMLPNMTPLLAYLTAVSVGGAVISISTLQFLGIGSLTIETWGAMLNVIYSNYFAVVNAWWLVYPPAIAVTMFVFAFIFVSRGLDEVVNPRIRSR